MVRPLFTDEEPQTVDSFNFYFILLMRALALYLPKATHLHTRAESTVKASNIT